MGSRSEVAFVVAKSFLPTLREFDNTLSDSLFQSEPERESENNVMFYFDSIKWYIDIDPDLIKLFDFLKDYEALYYCLEVNAEYKETNDCGNIDLNDFAIGYSFSLQFT